MARRKIGAFAVFEKEVGLGILLPWYTNQWSVSESLY